MKLVLIAIGAAVFAFAAPAHAADSTNDPMSGLPLYPGLHASNNAMNLTICRKQGQFNQYLLRATTAAAIAWYKGHLPGYHFYHAFWDDRSQDTSWSPDGTKGVSITGTPKSDQVFSVMYLQMKTGLTDHERAVFGPSNPTCK
ncbi:MAG: hypothetical protein ACRD20_09965 [Terriglobales bacterium]